MHWFQGPQHWLDHHKLSRDRRHEPFTPGVPEFILSHQTLFSAVMVVAGILGNWTISSRMADWPAWMLFPSMILAVLSLLAMVVGLGILTVRLLEPALALMDLNWDAEPLAQLGIPLPLQRKCEALGYWTAEELTRAVDKGKFPWTTLEYDERMQIQRAAERWSRAVAAEKREQRGRGRLSKRQRREPAGGKPPGNSRGS
ncbi:MAG: hypothetical protein WEC79_00465 [Thermomicrobiales bacterium]